MILLANCSGRRGRKFESCHSDFMKEDTGILIKNQGFRFLSRSNTCSNNTNLRKSCVMEIVNLAVRKFTDDFEIGSLKIKTSNTPDRIKGLENLGHVPSKTFRRGMGYHEYNS